PHTSTLSLHDALPIFTIEVHSATPTTSVATIDDHPYTLGSAYGVEGQHAIKVVVTNQSGLSTTVGPYPFTIDLTKPTVALSESRSEEHTSELQSRSDL